jgi:hypothetical protein
MAARRYFLEKRVMVNGKSSHINLDNYLDLREYIALVALGSTSSATPLTFQNGLTKDAFNIATLGGTLTASTTISKDGHFFRTNGQGDNILRTIEPTSDTITEIQTTNNTTFIRSSDNLNTIYSEVTVDITGDVSIASSGASVSSIFLTQDIGDGTAGIFIAGIPAYDDDAAAGLAGLTSGVLFQTTGLGAAPLDEAGILMIKQ